MKQVIRKASIDVIHIYQDESLWCIMRTFSKNKPKRYFVVNEYNHLNEEMAPREVKANEINSIFKYDVISMFDENK